MHVNGFIIQEYKERTYKGIDGSGFSEKSAKNWYLNDHEMYQEQFEPFYDEYIGKTYWNLKPHTWVAACTDLDYIYRYIEVSKELGIKYRVLLVKTEISMPTVEIDKELEMEFLGYDYAYENGDNYSAVYNEIPFVFPEFELNQNGLFQTKEEIIEYISRREEYEKTHKPYTLEVGDFTIFEVYEVIL